MKGPYRLFDVTGKVVFITGGNRGIGLALSVGMAAAGAKIVIASRGRASGEAAVEQIKQAGGEAVWFQADLADPPSVPALIRRTVERFGRIDVLINNVAARIDKPAEEHTAEDWEHILRTNVISAALLAQSAAVEMKKRGGGKIIYISSNLSQRAIDRRSSYGATKGALEALARHQALEWARCGVNVNVLAPGSTETKELSGAMRANRERYAALRDMIPLGRPADPEDMLGMALFLSSDASRYVTGQTFFVDGGWTIATLPSSVLFGTSGEEKGFAQRNR